jgi:hypothetical protein
VSVSVVTLVEVASWPRSLPVENEVAVEESPGMVWIELSKIAWAEMSS